MDDFSAHKTENVLNSLKEMKIDVSVIPGGFTSVLQPLDVSLNKPFKDFYRQLWNEWMDSPNPVYTKGGNRQKSSYQTLSDRISTSIEKSSSMSELIKKSFVICGIVNQSTKIPSFNHRLSSILTYEEEDWDLEIHHHEYIESGAFKSNVSLVPSNSFENFEDLEPASDQPSFEEE